MRFVKKKFTVYFSGITRLGIPKLEENKDLILDM